MTVPLLVWFKRDLRLADHAPLAEAVQAGRPIILLYILEPELFNNRPYDKRHVDFVAASIKNIQSQLSLIAPDFKLLCLEGNALDLLQKLQKTTHFSRIYSYEETGIAYTYQRDKAIASWCKRQNIEWKEFPTNGIIRPCKNRDEWQQNWFAQMHAPLFSVDWRSAKVFKGDEQFEQLFSTCRWHYHPHEQDAHFQPAGESFAHKYLQSFLTERHQHYARNISKPETSRRSCSRLSVYLAWGNLSMRQVVQALKHSSSNSRNKQALQAFSSRLIWHCHFIQKFESECRMEHEALNRTFSTIRSEWREDHYQAWENGQTGYPLVDACIRCVKATGYLNFRMRAMLVSFLTHHLWLDWKRGADFLGSQFLDFEPGIHYAQFQMQAGLMGINTIRIYNPVKQSIEHDPDAIFLHKWIPELRQVPAPIIHEVWKMTLFEQQLYQCKIGLDYPAPIVDLKVSGARARTDLWRCKQSQEARAESKRILKRHVKSRLRKFKEANSLNPLNQIDT